MMALNVFRYLTVLSDETVAVYGKEDNKRKLNRYSLQSGKQLGSTDPKEACGAMAEITLGGRPALVLSL